MKLRGILMFTLFPFMHTTSYDVQFVSCEANKIVVQREDTSFEVSLFNTKIINKKGMEITCEILKKAESIRFEIDPTSKIEEPLPVYLFVDDKLIQEEVMKQGYGYPMIRNPEYTYEKQLEQAYDTMQTMAKPVEKEKKKTYPLIGPLCLGISFLIWVCIFVYMYIRYKRKKGA